MDTTVLNKMKSELEAEIARLETEIAPLQAQLSRKRDQLDALVRVLQIEAGEQSPTMAVNGRANGITETAYQVLTERAKPAHYGDLLEMVEAAGTTVPGRQPGANLIAHLTRDARFVRVGNGVYGLADWGMKAMPKRRRAKRTKRG